MDTPRQDAVVNIDPIPAGSTTTLHDTAPAPAPEATTAPEVPAASPEVKREPRRVPWGRFFLGRDWVRGADSKPEEGMVKAMVKDPTSGKIEEKLVGTGKYRMRNQHLPGDTVVDGNGDSYLVMPDMSLRAITKYEKRKERRERREERKARLKELREGQMTPDGSPPRSKRVLWGNTPSPG